MINKAKKILQKFNSLFKPEGLREGHSIANSTESIEFVLTYNMLPVGILTFYEEVWKFEYTNQFKIKKSINTLTEFPDIDTIYKSKVLFPFFMHRIPSPSQPKIKEIIEKEKINEHNITEMLKRFGRLTITSPFELKPNSVA